VRNASDGAPNVEWVRPEEAKYVLPPMPEPDEQHEKGHTFVVRALTVACALLALFDVFLLVWGF